MNQTFIIEPNSWLPAGGFLIFVILGFAMAWRTSVIFRAAQIVRSPMNVPEQSRKTYQLIRRSAGLEIGWRALLAICSLVVAGLFYLNAYTWYRRIELTEQEVRLGFCWPKSEVLIVRTEVVSIQTDQNRNQRKHLSLVTSRGQRYRSVSTDQSQLIEELSSALIPAKSN